MGSKFEITAVHADEGRGRAAIDAAYAEIERIEALISEWRESSKVSEINRQAGSAPVEVPKELLHLARRALKVSALTDGAFDVTFHTVGRLWNFKSRTAPVPTEEAIRAALEDAGYRHVILDEAKSTVFLDRKGTRIGFGAIGKGYAANRAVFVLKEHGVTGGVVNAGGDLVVFGTQESGRSRRTGRSPGSRRRSRRSSPRATTRTTSRSRAGATRTSSTRAPAGPSPSCAASRSSAPTGKWPTRSPPASRSSGSRRASRS